MAVLHNLNVGSICAWVCSVLVDTLDMMISNSVLYKKISAWQFCKVWELWLLMDFYKHHFDWCSGILLGLCSGIHLRNNIWSLTDKVTLVLMWSLLSLTFFFIKAASLVYLLPIYCSHFEEWFFFYSGNIISCDSHPLCLWLLTHLPQTFPSFAGVKPPQRMQTLTAMFWFGMDFISTFIIPIVLAVLFA